MLSSSVLNFFICSTISPPAYAGKSWWTSLLQDLIGLLLSSLRFRLPHELDWMTPLWTQLAPSAASSPLSFSPSLPVSSLHPMVRIRLSPQPFHLSIWVSLQWAGSQHYILIAPGSLDGRPWCQNRKRQLEFPSVWIHRLQRHIWSSRRIIYLWWGLWRPPRWALVGNWYFNRKSAPGSHPPRPLPYTIQDELYLFAPTADKVNIGCSYRIRGSPQSKSAHLSRTQGELYDLICRHESTHLHPGSRYSPI